LEQGTLQVVEAFEDLESLPLGQYMEAFARLGVRPDVALPPPSAGDPPPWMAKRPAGVKAFLRDFEKFGYHHSTRIQQVRRGV
jgi:hypothetical protein